MSTVARLMRRQQEEYSVVRRNVVVSEGARHGRQAHVVPHVAAVVETVARQPWDGRDVHRQVDSRVGPVEEQHRHGAVGLGLIKVLLRRELRTPVPTRQSQAFLCRNEVGT